MQVCEGMKETILIAGGTGLVGRFMVSMLPRDRYDIRILTRSPKPPRDNITYWSWDIDAKTIQAHATDVDHIINLAGAGIADSRWTDKRKQELIDSRVVSTKILAEAIKSGTKKPKSYVSASAVGYYGDRGEEILTEDSTSGTEFMSEICKKWEEAALLIKPHVDRHAILRIGIVLSTQGGALPKILMTRHMGVFNYFGDGRQYYPWVHIEDLCRMFLYCIEQPDISGVLNAVAPEPLINKEFTKKIMRACSSSGLLLPAPRFALRLALGEMANVVLNSNQVVPKRLDRLQFKYTFPDLQDAVKDLLNRNI